MDLTTVHHGVHKRRGKKRVGRGVGSGHGKTSSRGHKGQWASAGAKKPAFTFEGGQMPLFRRMPKRGFSHATWDRHYHVVNVGDIDARFNAGDTVDAEALAKVGLAKGRADGVRVLGTGEVTKKLTIKASHFSKSAAEKIAGQGGTAEVIPGPKKPVKNKMGTRKKALEAKYGPRKPKEESK
jgi:large subunit ribosomal protein L15